MKKKRRKHKRKKNIPPAKKVTVSEIERMGSVKRKHIIAVSAISMISFFAILLIFQLMTVFGEKKTFSELENRTLEKFPKFSAKSYFSGSFADDLEVYTADHFFCRDEFITMKTYIDMALGKHERSGVYILKDRLVQRFDEPDDSVVSASIEGINSFAADNDIPVFVMLAPTSGEIYSDELPKNAPMASEKEFIDSVYSRLSDSIGTIDAYTVLNLNRNDYICYRNDHHWTTKGAYLAYTAAGKKMGYAPVTMDGYDIEHAAAGFKGTLYSSALYNGIEADTVDYYHCIGGYDITGEDVTEAFGSDPVHYDDIYFREYLGKKDKYSSFTGQNQPMVTITSDSPGGKLLIFKDSYAHCYVPFLMQHYSEVTMVDLRYIQLDYKELIDVSSYDQVMFLYNALTFSTDRNLKKLKS